MSLRGIIRCYQLLISPFLGHQCRFHPSCSNYSSTALSRHGLRKGLSLSVKRICSCHPLHEGGVDPVPSISTNHSQQEGM